jgi:hypothetical protein
MIRRRQASDNIAGGRPAMIIPRILASDTTAAAIMFLFALVVLFACGAGGLMINRHWGRGRWWGLVLALIPLALGGFAEFYLLTVRGGAPPFAHMIALLPLLVGIRSLQLWRRAGDDVA